MKRMFSASTMWVATLALLSLCALPVSALDTAKLKPTGYVNDFTGVLDAASQQTLEAYCTNLERTTGAQLAIVLVNSLEDEPVEDVANRLYREWGIGKKGKDEGALILLSIRDHKSRAEIGYGLEPIITDGQAGGILRGVRPILRQGNYGGALLAVVEQIGKQIAQAKGADLGEPAVARTRRAVRGPSIPFPLIVIGFLFLLALLNRGGGGGGGLLTGMLLGNMLGGGRGGWGGGGFGGYDGGGSGGGGFGGFGGGSSGGGGASSDW
jgi:uncharacterized protein